MTAANSPALLQSFGRRLGRKLRTHQSELMQTLLPQLKIPLSESDISLTSLFADPVAPLWFEIGFGGGEHLVEQARRNPHINFIGCEPFINGMAKLLASIDKANLKNLRLSDGDARLVLERLPDASLERLFLLFPDPWPKVRHHKRRIVSQEGLALFYRKLKKGGLLRLVTDHADYGTWMLEQLLAFGQLEWAAKSSNDWKTPPNDWVRTRYQAKAEAEGRGALFLNWIKPL
jgi:tRNA (guanine-N7-)-methyltransferase